MPVVNQHMKQLGVVSLYDDLMSRYQKIPFAPDLKFDLDSYVSEQALDGLFKVLADEEKRIREDPAARTTALLKRVFGK
jgi:hypothetical protein